MIELLIALNLLHPWGKPDWADDGPWRYMGVTQDYSATYFVQDYSIERAGSAMAFEMLEITSSPHADWGTDQYHRHYLVDCTSFAYRVTHYQPFKNGEVFPPPIVRRGTEPTARPGSVEHSVISRLCANEANLIEETSDPYTFAQSLFANRP